MIEIWMKYSLINDNNCNIVNLKQPTFFLQNITSNVTFVFGVVTLQGRFKISIEQDK